MVFGETERRELGNSRLSRLERSEAYRAERGLQNTEAVRFASVLVLVIAALSYIVGLTSVGIRDPSVALRLGTFLVVLVASLGFLARTTIDRRAGRATSYLLCGAFWFIVIAVGTVGWANSLRDMQGFVAYVVVLLGAAVLFRAHWKLHLWLFFTAATLISGYCFVNLGLPKAATFIAYAYIYAMISFVIAVRLGRDHLRIYLGKAELVAKNAVLEELSLRDPLTQLFNRRYLMEALAREMKLAKRENRRISVGMVDTDHFKKINDEFGHTTGDTVLKDLAVVMLDVLRESDIVARYGGEEFLVILSGCDLDRGRMTAERLRMAVENRDFRGVPWRITVSVGVTVVQDRDNEELLLSRVDKLLYQAKHAGRNLVFAE
jgi:diguanylate cyclase (GGDEF)-like protein